MCKSGTGQEKSRSGKERGRIMKGEYRKIDSEEVSSFETISELADDFREIVEKDDFIQKIDDIESDVGDIIDLLESFELKEAVDKIKELKDKLY